MTQTSEFVNQALASVYNFLNTSRPNKAVQMLGVVTQINPNAEFVNDFWDLVAWDHGRRPNNIIHEFGYLWRGEDLNGKSIEVMCDQGMGDIINMLRYLKEMKNRWDCHIVLNCYAYHQELERLMTTIDYVDEFVKYHKRCDFHTNVFSIPAILTGIELDVYYPAYFELIMQKEIPPQPLIGSWPLTTDGKIRIGVAWRSNPNNVLSTIKSIDTEIIEMMASDHYELYSLDPSQTPPFMEYTRLHDLQDTVKLMETLDAVVSVDTVVLHLAGAMGITTFGLIPTDADPRWDRRTDISLVSICNIGSPEGELGLKLFVN
jgi:hypothetical protein